MYDDRPFSQSQKIVGDVWRFQISFREAYFVLNYRYTVELFCDPLLVSYIRVWLYFHSSLGNHTTCNSLCLIWSTTVVCTALPRHSCNQNFTCILLFFKLVAVCKKAAHCHVRCWKSIVYNTLVPTHLIWTLNLLQDSLAKLGLRWDESFRKNNKCL